MNMVFSGFICITYGLENDENKIISLHNIYTEEYKLCNGFKAGMTYINTHKNTIYRGIMLQK